jgi:hypothetical protein
MKMGASRLPEHLRASFRHDSEEEEEQDDESTGEAQAKEGEEEQLEIQHVQGRVSTVGLTIQQPSVSGSVSTISDPVIRGLPSEADSSPSKGGDK